MPRKTNAIQFIHSSHPKAASAEAQRQIHSHAARAAHAGARRQRVIEYQASKASSDPAHEGPSRVERNAISGPPLEELASWGSAEKIHLQVLLDVLIRWRISFLITVSCAFLR